MVGGYDIIMYKLGKVRRTRKNSLVDPEMELQTVRKGATGVIIFASERITLNPGDNNVLYILI